jgi:DNA-binding response OmpR family regulator
MLNRTRRGPPVIALVEDDSSITELLCELLREDGYRTISCLNAEQAFQTIRRAKPDLLILDLHLNGSESGFAVLDILRLTPSTKDIPVIVCSADTKLLYDKEEELRLAKCQVLEKPFDIDAFLSKVKDALAVPRKRASAAVRADSMTVRATKRLQLQPPAIKGQVFVLPRNEPQFSEQVQESYGEATPTAADAEPVQVRYAQQLIRQSQALRTSSQSLRNQTAKLIEELRRTRNQVDTTAWLQAMSGPQPRWLWRGRKPNEDTA